MKEIILQAMLASCLLFTACICELIPADIKDRKITRDNFYDIKVQVFKTDRRTAEEKKPLIDSFKLAEKNLYIKAYEECRIKILKKDKPDNKITDKENAGIDSCMNSLFLDKVHGLTLGQFLKAYEK